MRYIRIFLLHFQYVFEHRSRSFVWFLISLFSPFVMFLFYKGASVSQQNLIPWSLTQITSYYFFLVIATSFLTSHVEEDVAREDIQEGMLVKYLTKPFSYYWINFFEELPYRVLQGFFGVVVLCIGTFIFRVQFSFVTDIPSLLLSILIILLAYMLCFTFKMIIGLLAFWVVDISGLYQMIEALFITFGGYIVPLAFMPEAISYTAMVSPFPYMIYFPITAIAGIETISSLIQIVGIQMVWLGVLSFIYTRMWHAGIQKFSAVGQ